MLLYLLLLRSATPLRSLEFLDCGRFVLVSSALACSWIALLVSYSVLLWRILSSRKRIWNAQPTRARELLSLRGPILVEQNLLRVHHRIVVCVWLVGFEFGRGSTSLIIDFAEEISALLWITTRIKVLLATSSQIANMSVSLCLKGWIRLLLATAMLWLVEHTVISNIWVPIGPEPTRLWHLVLGQIGLVSWVW